MQKYLSFPLGSTGLFQLVSASDVILVYADGNDASKTYIHYAGGVVVVVYHVAQVGYSMRTAIQDAIVAALTTPWQNVTYAVTPPQLVESVEIYVAA